MLKIDTQPVVYYSQFDEDLFFAWAQETPCIKSIDRGYLHIQESEVDEQVQQRAGSRAHPRSGPEFKSLFHTWSALALGLYRLVMHVKEFLWLFSF